MQFKYTFDFQWLRIFYVYDETGESGSNIISSLKNSILNGDSKFHMSDGEQEYDFIEVKELSRIIVKVILQTKVNGILNCCTGTPIKVIDLVKKCLSFWGENIVLNPGSFSYREFESLKIYGNIKKIEKALKT